MNITILLQINEEKVHLVFGARIWTHNFQYKSLLQ